MTYWDSSALVPLIVDQGPYAELRARSQVDPVAWTWWASEVECVSALARLEREEDPALGSDSYVRLATLARDWRVVPPDAVIQLCAVRLLRVHPLRAADALQLAAALAAADGVPQSLPFVTLDRRLAQAAEIEGFPVEAPGGRLS